MNDLTKIPTHPADADIVTVPVANFDAKGYVGIVFDPFKKQISKAKRDAAKVEAYDITTTAGMSQAKELRASFRDIRTGIENERKLRKAPIIEAGKLLDSRAAELKAEVEPLEDKYDAEIKAEEARKAAEKARKEAEERARVEAIENRIANIRNVPARMASASSKDIAAEINQWTILRLDPADYQEYLEDALTSVNTTLGQLETLLVDAEKREAEARQAEADRAELARLRAEQDARDKAEREAAAERERIAKAERDQAEADRRAAAAREADLLRQMEEMRRDMAAKLAALQPALTAAPVDPTPVPVQAGIIAAAPDGDVTGDWLASLPSMQGIDMAQPGTDMTVKVDLSTGTVEHIVAQPVRPEDGELVEVLAAHYGVSIETATYWLLEFGL